MKYDVLGRKRAHGLLFCPEVYTATDGFRHLLGMGAYGIVYRGFMRDGLEVAVKRLNDPSEAGFEREVIVLSKFSGIFTSLDCVPVVMSATGTLTWHDRLSIALDTAVALSHLHRHCLTVYHRDIKTANILLDKHKHAKVSDFGLACLAKKGKGRFPVRQTAGTVGYADPKYIARGVRHLHALIDPLWDCGCCCSSMVSEMAEVYSLGMVMLELLTAKPPVVINSDGTVTFVLALLARDFTRLTKAADPQAGFPSSVLHAFAEIAVSCIQDDDTKRPSFQCIVRQLRCLKEAATSICLREWMRVNVSWRDDTYSWLLAASPGPSCFCSLCMNPNSFSLRDWGVSPLLQEGLVGEHTARETPTMQEASAEGRSLLRTERASTLVLVPDSVTSSLHLDCGEPLPTEASEDLALDACAMCAPSTATPAAMHADLMVTAQDQSSSKAAATAATGQGAAVTMPSCAAFLAGPVKASPSGDSVLLASPFWRGERESQKQKPKRPARTSSRKQQQLSGEGDCRLLVHQRRLRGCTGSTTSTMTNGGSIGSMRNSGSNIFSNSSNSWNSCSYSNHSIRSTMSTPADRLLLYADFLGDAAIPEDCPSSRVSTHNGVLIASAAAKADSRCVLLSVDEASLGKVVKRIAALQQPEPLQLMPLQQQRRVVSSRVLEAPSNHCDSTSKVPTAFLPADDSGTPPTASIRETRQPSAQMRHHCIENCNSMNDGGKTCQGQQQLLQQKHQKAHEAPSTPFGFASSLLGTISLHDNATRGLYQQRTDAHTTVGAARTAAPMRIERGQEVKGAGDGGTHALISSPTLQRLQQLLQRILPSCILVYTIGIIGGLAHYSDSEHCLSVRQVDIYCCVRMLESNVGSSEATHAVLPEGACAGWLALQQQRPPVLQQLQQALDLELSKQGEWVRRPLRSPETGEPINWLYEAPESGYEPLSVYGPETVLVEGLPMGRTPEFLQERLWRYFSRFGRVKSVHVLPHKLDPYQTNGKAFVAFEKEEADCCMESWKLSCLYTGERENHDCQTLLCVHSETQKQIDRWLHKDPLPEELQTWSRSKDAYKIHDERHQFKIRLRRERKKAELHRRLQRAAVKRAAELQQQQQPA
ncbi:tyrosine kinase-like [Cyclospora cayetanensis]|uniref:Tyrosine kinase-like n=1 Tax=Cyclospora cayetanensis TaxID=88456 RepID=A0A1D3CZG4_9EIME|nr:tyrosine kinase-like [Cyclospora cayetanensis]